jgi:hypothetical protein
MPAESLEALRHAVDHMQYAVQALMVLTRTPQERLDRALAAFARGFRDEPDGPARAPYRRIYEAIGNPPYGTTMAVRLEILTADEQNALVESLFALYEEMARRCREAECATRGTGEGGDR